MEVVLLQHADLMFWLLVPMLSGCGPREGNSQSRYQFTHYKCGEVHEGIAVGEDIFPYTIICTTEYSEDGATQCFENRSTVLDGVLVPECPDDPLADVYVMEIDEEFTTLTFVDFDVVGVPEEEGFPFVVYGLNSTEQRTRARYSPWKISEGVLTTGMYSGSDPGWVMKVAWIDAGEDDEQACMYPAAGIDAVSLFPLFEVCNATYRECWEGLWQITDNVLFGGNGTWETTPCSAEEWAKITWL